MTGSLELTTIADTTSNFTKSGPVCPVRTRTLFIWFTTKHTGYQLHIEGRGMPAHGATTWTGDLEVAPETIQGWIGALGEAWDQHLIRWHSTNTNQTIYPLADQVDLRQAVGPADLRRMWQRLARAGHELFTLLFHGPDDSLKLIGERLAEALRADRHTITVISDDVVVPWPMLYVPPDPAQSLDGDVTVDPTGFWGYRHLVEHRFHSGPTQVGTRYSGRPSAAAYINRHILTAQGPVAAPAIRILERRTSLTSRTESDELEQDLRGPARQHHVLYFSCHCKVHDRAAKLELSDTVPVPSARFDAWLQNGRLIGNPLVFITACEAGHLGASPHHFGRTLLHKGANCLVSPYVAIPRPFARRYVIGMLCQALRPHQHVGEAVQATTVFHIERFANPLGLTFSVYQGIDSHLCPEDAHGSA
jgi:hypothetical protein